MKYLRLINRNYPFTLFLFVLLAVIPGQLFAQFTPSHQGTSKVTIVVEDISSPQALTTKAELRAMGFNVEMVSLDAPVNSTSSNALAAVATNTDALAVIQLMNLELAVWAADLDRKNTVFRTTSIDGGEDSDDDPAITAVTAVELLRACLFEIDEKSKRSSGQENEGTVKESIVDQESEMHGDKEPKERSQFSLEAGFAVSAVSFDIKPTMNVFIGAHYAFHEHFGVSLVGLTPLLSSKNQETEGEIEVHTGLIGGGLRYSFTDAGKRLRPCIGLGGGALLLNMEGRTDGDYLGQEKFLATGVVFARAGLAAVLKKNFRLRFDVFAGFLTSKTTLSVLQQPVAELGPVMLSGVLSVDLSVK